MKAKKLLIGLATIAAALTTYNIAESQPDEALYIDSYDMWVVTHTYEDGCQDVKNSRTDEYKFVCAGVWYDELQPLD